MEHAGHGELAAPRAAADVVGGFEYLDIDPVLGEADGGGEAVGPGADDDGGGHHRAPAATAGDGRSAVATTEVATMEGARSAWSAVVGRVQATCSGIGPFGSHGSSSTVSATL